VRIPSDKLAQLQLNLVRSHAGGWGSRSLKRVARHAAAAGNVLAKGFSGCRVELVQLLVAAQCGRSSVIPEKGSVVRAETRAAGALALVSSAKAKRFIKASG